MAKKIPGWVWAIVIVIVLCVAGIIAMAGAGLYFVSRQMHVQSATPATAEREFESLREQFTGREPLLEIDEDGDVVHSNIEEALRNAPPNPPQLTALHLVVWDSDNERLVKFDIPFWLMRLKQGPISVITETGHIRSRGLVLTVRDLERLGPAMLIDHRDHRGTRVLAWTQ
jgi:hypothetical protein